MKKVDLDLVDTDLDLIESTINNMLDIDITMFCVVNWDNRIFPFDDSLYELYYELYNEIKQ